MIVETASPRRMGSLVRQFGARSLLEIRETAPVTVFSCEREILQSAPAKYDSATRLRGTVVDLTGARIPYQLPAVGMMRFDRNRR
jgi:hypothetical protein